MTALQWQSAWNQGRRYRCLYTVHNHERQRRLQLVDSTATYDYKSRLCLVTKAMASLNPSLALVMVPMTATSHAICLLVTAFWV